MSCSIDVDKILSQIFPKEEIVGDAWSTSRYSEWQKLPNKMKGTRGEQFINVHLQSEGVASEHLGGTEEPDLLINGTIPVEVKTGFAQRDKGKIKIDSFIFNHLGLQKEWDYAVFLGINPENTNPFAHVRRGWRSDYSELNICVLSKEEVIDLIEAGIFYHQQGGKEGGNDDYMSKDAFNKMYNYFADKPLQRLLDL